MTRKNTLFWVILGLVIALGFPNLASAGRDSILLEDVKTLTLHAGRMTRANRVAAVPQLQCVGFAPIPPRQVISDTRDNSQKWQFILCDPHLGLEHQIL